MANKKRFENFDSSVDVRVHNGIMSIYASDEQLARMNDVEVRPATTTDIELAKLRRCKLY